MLIHIAADHRPTADDLLSRARNAGLLAQSLDGGNGRHVIGIGGPLEFDRSALPGIDRVIDAHPAFMLASREAKERTIVRVGGVEIGGGSPVIIAGPCSVEGRDAIIEHARAAKDAGAMILRGGAFKPRTSPYSFQGFGIDGLQFLAEARDATGLPVVTEVLEPEQVDAVAEYADMVQVGSRNMANFQLLKRVGGCGKPVLLKRGFAATMDEFLMSAEYLMAHGNADVVLCERGIRTGDTAFRFNLDLNVVPAIKRVSHLPVLVDPSHGTGRRELVHQMALAGIAAGADGLALEVHPRPDEALSDGFQTITPSELSRIVTRVRAIADVLRETEEPVVELPTTETEPVELSA